MNMATISTRKQHETTNHSKLDTPCRCVAFISLSQQSQVSWLWTGRELTLLFLSSADVLLVVVAYQHNTKIPGIKRWNSIASWHVRRIPNKEQVGKRVTVWSQGDLPSAGFVFFISNTVPQLFQVGDQSGVIEFYNNIIIQFLWHSGGWWGHPRLTIVKSYVWSAGSDGLIKEWNMTGEKRECLRQVAPPGSEKGEELRKKRKNMLSAACFLPCDASVIQLSYLFTHWIIPENDAGIQMFSQSCGWAVILHDFVWFCMILSISQGALLPKLDWCKAHLYNFAPSAESYLTFLYPTKLTTWSSCEVSMPSYRWAMTCGFVAIIQPSKSSRREIWHRLLRKMGTNPTFPISSAWTGLSNFGMERSVKREHFKQLNAEQTAWMILDEWTLAAWSSDFLQPWNA